jgi:hypothetical protein
VKEQLDLELEDAPVPAPEELWTEDCEVLWIRADLCTRAQARYLAHNGRSSKVAYSLEGEPFWLHDVFVRLIDLRVKKQWLRDTSDGGWDEGWDEFPWEPCDRTAEGAVAYWRVTCP